MAANAGASSNVLRWLYALLFLCGGIYGVALARNYRGLAEWAAKRSSAGFGKLFSIEYEPALVQGTAWVIVLIASFAVIVLVFAPSVLFPN